MKTCVIILLGILTPFVSHAQDTIPQIVFRDCDNTVHQLYIDTVSITRFGDKRNNIFFLTRDSVWREIPLYPKCPPCNIEIISCRYRSDGVLSIKTILVFTEIYQYFVYTDDTWESIPAPE